MTAIASRQNPRFKALKKLAESSRERRQAGRTLLDGEHLIEAWRQEGRGVECWVRAESSSYAIPPGAETLTLPDALFAELSPVKTPTGILAQVAIPAPMPPEHPALCLFVEDVQDPGNLGTLLRSAAAAGCEVAYLSAGCADPWAPKTLRAGMGAQFVLAMCERQDLSARVAAFQGITVAATLDGETSLYDLDLKGPTGFLVGNEGAGLSPTLAALASHRARIPMPGRVESLNAAAAVAICLFERVRQASQA